MVKEFEWADKEKLTSLGIEYKSYESNDGSFGIHIADTQEDEYFYVYIYAGPSSVWTQSLKSVVRKWGG